MPSAFVSVIWGINFPAQQEKWKCFEYLKISTSKKIQWLNQSSETWTEVEDIINILNDDYFTPTDTYHLCHSIDSEITIYFKAPVTSVHHVIGHALYAPSIGDAILGNTDMRFYGSYRRTIFLGYWWLVSCYIWYLDTYFHSSTIHSL